MSELVHEETNGKATIKIYYDTDPENPRSWDNLGTMICGHPRYNLGDDHSFDGGRAFLLDLLKLDEDVPYDVDAFFTRAQKQAIILPVYLYDHSGLAMNTSGFSCPWDSGQVGFIYVTLEEVRNEYKVQRVTQKLRQCISEFLSNEVKTYSDYLSGNVYGYVIEEDGVETESCWGFIGDYDDHCLKEARNCVPLCKAHSDH
jgi:hypothetical protein